MRKSLTQKPTVVIAGPGAGKTCQMVARIADAIPRLSPVRFLAAITYTNAASDLIRFRLQQRVSIPPNVFVGTTHSFLSRFILRPYASLFGHLPDDRLFMAVDVDGMVSRGKRGRRNANGRNRAIQRHAVMARLTAKGIVPFEKMASVAAELMSDRRVAAAACNRLQYLFVDEFQDVDTSQSRIFEAIRQGQSTHIYVVGDPEQYISSFTYKVRSARAPQFKSIPFFRFSEKAQIVRDSANHRACAELVEFTNQFHSELDQTPVHPRRGCPCVFFIAACELKRLVESFRELSKRIREANPSAVRFYLAFQGDTFLSLKQQYGLTPISNDAQARRSVLREAVGLICAAYGRSQTALCKEGGLDLVALRRVALQVIRALRMGKVKDDQSLHAFLSSNESLRLSVMSHAKVEDQLHRLLVMSCDGEAGGELERYSTIHKAKGLEADAVLVVARNEKELAKWVTTSKDERCKDANDDCRVGYVAFSRAKELLCVGCLKKVGGKLRNRIMGLGVSVT